MEPTAAPAKDLVQTLLDFAAGIIIPDWRALILLLPIALAILFALWFVVTLRGWRSVGPRRRRPARVEPVTPATVHMPGGSVAPLMVALGAALLFAGLVVGGIGLWIGVTAMVLTLLVWFREAIRDYDRIEPTQRLPAVIHEGPPPGVHMPGPSIRPLMGALGSAALLGGLVVGGWVLVLAVVFLVYTLIGWLIDFTAEYRKVEEADRTGHLENIAPRRLPVRTLQAFAVLFALVGLAQLGVFPPTAPAAGGVPGASGAPASGGPGPGPGGPLVLVAKDIAFDKRELAAPANGEFTIELKNDDPVDHDIDIQGDGGGPVVADQQPVTGGKSAVYTYKPLPAGTYQFFCSVHPGVPGMTGKLTVQ